MNTIGSFLTNAVDIPLVSYRKQTETQVSFANRVERLLACLKSSASLPGKEFILVTEENPISFYALLLALWENGNRTILPTRDFYADPKSISYYASTICCQGSQVRITENSAFDPGKIPTEGDVVAFSSGSTGAPKGILHEHTHFITNAIAVSKQIKETGVTSITYLKPYLVSALSHLFVHFLTGSHLWFEDYENVHKSNLHFANRPDMGIVGSPVHLTSALQFIPRTSAPRLFFSSGDFLSAASSTRILKTFTNAVIYNVYGLAELAGRFFINRIDSMTPVEQYETIGSPIEGTRYRIDRGQLYVNANFLFNGYIRNACFEPAAEWHPSQDLARVGDDGLYLVGRANDEIKVMGNKVSLKHIENRIKRILDRDVAVVLANEHSAFGNILSLVLADGTGLNRQDLIRQLRAELKPYEIPHQFFLMEKIPFTQSMKIDRGVIANRIDSLKAIK